MNFLVIVFLFLVWRLLDFLVLFFAPRIIPYLGFFPYKEILPLYRLPDWLTKLANFDGTHYLLIAQQGYMQYEQAYFPLYSLLIKAATPLFLNNGFLAAFFISNLSFMMGLWFFSKYLSSIGINNKAVVWIIILLLAFPSSFFCGAIYTEGLFFFLFAAILYSLKKKNYLLTGLFAFSASFTRLIGIFLPIFFVFNFIQNQRSIIKLKIQNKNIKSQNIFSILYPPYSILFIFSFFGLLTYCLYLWKTTGDPFFFFSSQPIFGANRSTSLILLPQVYWRYLKILFTANHDFRYYVSITEMVIFTFVFVVLIFDLFRVLKLIKKFKFKIINLDRLALNLFSFANLLLPTLTGTFSSIPRYAFFSISMFVFLGNINSRMVKTIILIIYFVCHIFLLGFFSQGYFVS